MVTVKTVAIHTYSYCGKWLHLFNVENAAVASSKQAEHGGSFSEKPSSSPTAPAACVKAVVHFEYGDKTFAKRISIEMMSKFYKEVMSLLQNKKPACRPDNLQIQCGSCWYDFNKETEFDDLCLKDNSPELFVKAIPTPKDAGNNM